MSVNYHAFQSRGYLFSNSEVLREQWRAAFSGYDPARIASILHLTFDENYLYLSYFHRPYRLCLADGRLEKRVKSKETEAKPSDSQSERGIRYGQKKKTGQDEWTDELYFNEAMSIYHLLHYTKDHPQRSGVWVPNTAIDGVISRNPKMPDPLLTPFARIFTGKTEELKKACQKAGGTALDRGDVSCQFDAFPQIQLQLVFWDADEDFPAQAQVLVDDHITDFVHYETVGCMVSDLLELLENIHKQAQSDGRKTSPTALTHPDVRSAQADGGEASR